MVVVDQALVLVREARAVQAAAAVMTLYQAVQETHLAQAHHKETTADKQVQLALHQAAAVLLQ